MKNLLSTTFSTFLISFAAYANPTLIDINVQNDITMPGMRMRLSFDGVKPGPSDRYVVNSTGIHIHKDEAGNLVHLMDSRGNPWVYTHSNKPVRYHSNVIQPVHIQDDKAEKKTILNAWGTISLTKRLVGQSLYNGGLLDGHPSVSRWDSQKPVKLYVARQGSANNAYFSPSTQSIHFLPLKARKTGKVIGNTADDFDIAAHETGHNVSNILRPDRLFGRPQTGALDESLGDFLSYSTLLSLSPVRQRFFEETGGALRRTSFLSEAAESLSWATGRGAHGIRNALNQDHIDDVDSEVHALSTVHTGALYDVLVSAYDSEAPGGFYSFFVGDEGRGERLALINEDIRRLVLAAHCIVPFKNPSFTDFGNTMHQIASNNGQYGYLAPFIAEAYEVRGMDLSTSHDKLSVCDSEALEKHGPVGNCQHNHCGTMGKMQRKEGARLQYSLRNIRWD